jgi:hypothetical protein
MTGRIALCSLCSRDFSGAFDDPNSVSISAHIWTSSAQIGVLLPAGTDCFQSARADLAGAPQAPERFDAPRMARASDA